MNASNRLRCLCSLLGLIAAFGVSDARSEETPSAETKPTETRPNIVFLFADDWGWGDLSCHGHPWIKTPHLDRLAREGGDFLQFNVLNPVCSPSRTAAMTGQFPSRFCIHQHFATIEQNRDRGMPDWLDPQAPTLPRFLKTAGYRTGHFGKWHLTSRPTPDAPQPLEYGIDEAVVFNGGDGWPNGDAGLHDTADNAVKFIRENSAKPFYLNVWLHESHLPHVPTAESMERWKHLDEQQQVYAAVISDGDNAVGKVLAALDEAGVTRNTIVMFSSDNGPESTGAAKSKGQADPDTGSRGYGGYYSIGSTGGLRGRKRSLYEGGVRVPFLVRWPGHLPAGTRNDTTVITAVDLLPTLCAAAGVALPTDEQGDGENLVAALRGEPVRRSHPIYWKWTGKDAEPDWWPRLAVRDGDWKMVLNDDASRVELYHVPTDRSESKDVAAEHSEIVTRLKRMALKWQATLPTAPDPACLSRARADQPAPAAAPKPPKAAPDRAAAFVRWDRNRDGILTLEEYLPNEKDAAERRRRFETFDQNHDGRLERQEFVRPGER